MTTTPTPNSMGQPMGGGNPQSAKPSPARSAGGKTPTPKMPGAKAQSPKPAAAKAGTGGASGPSAASGKARPKPGPGKTMAGAAAGGAAGVTLGAGAMSGRAASAEKPAGKSMAGNGARKAGRLGKLAPQFPTAVKELHHYTTTPLPPAPASVDYAQTVKDGFPMDGNDQYGDCTMAAAAHLIQAWNGETGIQMPVPAEPDVIAEYLKLSGGQDTGLVESQVLQDWLSAGLWGNQIIAYAPVNVHSLDALKQAIAYFGGVYVGIQVPANAQTQFEQQQPWTLEAGWQSQKIEGGHAIPILGYDDQYMYCVTWGAVQRMSWDWWSIYGDEAWVVLSEEFDKAGKFNGIDVSALQADIANQ